SPDTSDEIGAVRLPRDEFALDPVSREVVAQELGSLCLVAGRVDRVEPEERLQERRDLVAQCHPPKTSDATDTVTSSASDMARSILRAWPTSSAKPPARVRPGMRRSRAPYHPPTSR